MGLNVKLIQLARKPQKMSLLGALRELYGPITWK